MDYRQLTGLSADLERLLIQLSDMQRGEFMAARTVIARALDALFKLELDAASRETELTPEEKGRIAALVVDIIKSLDNLGRRVDTLKGRLLQYAIH